MFSSAKLGLGIRGPETVGGRTKIQSVVGLRYSPWITDKEFIFLVEFKELIRCKIFIDFLKENCINFCMLRFKSLHVQAIKCNLKDDWFNVGELIKPRSGNHCIFFSLMFHGPTWSDSS